MYTLVKGVSVFFVHLGLDHGLSLCLCLSSLVPKINYPWVLIIDFFNQNTISLYVPRASYYAPRFSNSLFSSPIIRFWWGFFFLLNNVCIVFYNDNKLLDRVKLNIKNKKFKHYLRFCFGTMTKCFNSFFFFW